MLRAGLFASAGHWERLQTAHGWVVRAAQILENDAKADAATVEREYRVLLSDVLSHQASPELDPFATHYYMVSRSYWRGDQPQQSVWRLP